MPNSLNSLSKCFFVTFPYAVEPGFVAPTFLSSVHFSNRLLQSVFAKVRDKGKKQLLPAFKELMVCWGNQTCI